MYQQCTLYAVRMNGTTLCQRSLVTLSCDPDTFRHLCVEHGYFAQLAADERPRIMREGMGFHAHWLYPQTDGRDFATCFWCETRHRPNRVA